MEIAYQFGIVCSEQKRNRPEENYYIGLSHRTITEDLSENYQNYQRKSSRTLSEIQRPENGIRSEPAAHLFIINLF